MDEREIQNKNIEIEDMNEEPQAVNEDSEKAKEDIEELIKDLPEDLQTYIKNRVEGKEDDISIPQEQLDCILMNLLYLEAHDRIPGEDNIDLYPNDWFEDPDYNLQFKILTEAVMEKQKIIDTKSYNDSRKGKYTR